MFELVKFEASHMITLSQEPINKWVEGMVLSGQAAELEEGDNNFTFLIDGYPHMCGGIGTYWNGRGQLWSIFSERSKDNFLPSFRCIQRWLIEQRKIFRRIELSVDYEFEQGKRRAEMLGFKLEIERARKFLPNGKDVSLYAMVSE